MPSYITFGFTVLAAIMLFLYGLASFSAELTHLGGSRLQATLRKLTRTDMQAALMGTLATALVQSSSAITAMATGLAHKATLSNRSAFAIMIGANVGTTFTAWLVAFQIAGLGPIFVSIGGIVSFAAPIHYRPHGKAIFYFGLVFLALDLISQTLAPIGQHVALAQWQAFLHIPIFALLFAALLTALVQSSSVVTGLAVLLVQQKYPTCRNGGLACGGRQYWHDLYRVAGQCCTQSNCKKISTIKYSIEYFWHVTFRDNNATHHRYRHGH